MTALKPAPETAPDGSPHLGAPGPRINHEIPARQPWSGVIRRGERLRLVDMHGQQAIDVLFYNAGDHGERYSAQDTLRCQGGAYITVGTRIMSNEGRVMLTVPGDGAVEFVPALQPIAEAGYGGWLIVEAEQEPARAHPLTYARKGYAALRAAAEAAGFEVA